ncbi:hypothetical protein DFH06DRAFT_1220176 [Mycena polygramma]|nr:hypothetical protein DFH06DRAFT_1220176 [Mycena polygramma]
MSFLHNRLPALRNLSLFRSSPSLPTIPLTNASIFPLPWSQLKHLRLDFCATDECLILLKRASNLTYCSILYALPSTGPLPIVPPMLSLTFLDLRLPDEARSGPMLVALTLPALTHLAVFIRAPNVDDFFSFLDRSAPRLHFLRIHASLSETLLLKCLNHPALQSIQILYLIFVDDTVFPTPFILHLLHNPAFLPTLQRPFISEPSGGLPPSQHYERLLLDTLCRRRTFHAHFRRFTLRTQQRLQVPEVAQLRDLVTHGLKLEVELWVGDRWQVQPSWIVGEEPN